jgi:uncharacterized membrane protein YeiH
MNIVAWIAFGMLAGYTVVPMVRVDEELGTVGHVALASAAAIVGGLIGSLVLGVDPLGVRIEMGTVAIALVAAVFAIVGWNHRRGPLAGRRAR